MKNKLLAPQQIVKRLANGNYSVCICENDYIKIHYCLADRLEGQKTWNNENDILSEFYFKFFSDTKIKKVITFSPIYFRFLWAFVRQNASESNLFLEINKWFV